MLEQYGRQFEASYGLAHGDAYQKWATDLAEFTPQQIKNGLEALKLEGSEFPPNLIKLCRLCRTSVPTMHRHVDLAALPKPDVKNDPKVKAAAAKHFEACNKLGVL